MHLPFHLLPGRQMWVWLSLALVLAVKTAAFLVTTYLAAFWMLE